jgi:hypothetical protein
MPFHKAGSSYISQMVRSLQPPIGQTEGRLSDALARPFIAIDFVNSTQPYSLATPKSASKIDDVSALPESPRYRQAALASSLLQRLHSVNGSRLSKLPAPDAGSKNFGDFVAKAAKLETGESTGAWGTALNHLAEQNQYVSEPPWILI